MRINPAIGNRAHPSHVSHLFPQELREKQDKGLCFYCDEKYMGAQVLAQKDPLFGHHSRRR